MRVALGIPSNGTWHAEFGASLAGLCAQLVRDGIEFSLLNVRGPNVAENRSTIVMLALKNKCNAILWLDTDIEFPADLFRALCAHEKPIVGCTYAQREMPHMAIITELPTPTEGALRAVARLPGGCMLVSCLVYAGFPTPIYMERWDEVKLARVSEDHAFCDQARANGETIWLDASTSTRLYHVGKRRFQVSPEITHRLSIK